MDILHFLTLYLGLAIALVSGLLLILIRKWVPLHFLTAHHEVAFPIFLQIGVIYGVLLAFIFSMVWGEYDLTEKNIESEVGNLLEIVALSKGFDEKFQKNVQGDVVHYMEMVINKEWPKMKKRGEDWGASVSLLKLQKKLIQLDPKTRKENALYAQLIQHVLNAKEYRRLRILKASTPYFLRTYRIMGLLILFGIGIVVISYLFGMKNVIVQACLTASLAGTISGIIIMIIWLRHPFIGMMSIEPAPFQDALAQIQQLTH